MTRIHLSSLIVCWFILTGSRAADWKDISDPPAPKTVVAVEDKLADLAGPDSFFAPDVTYADRFGPFVALGRNATPQDSRIVYDLRTGAKVAELRGKLELHKPFALAPNGSLLAASGDFRGQTIVVYNVKTGEKHGEFKAEHRVNQLQFVDNDRLLTVADFDKVFAVYEAATGKQVRRFAQGRDVQGRPGISPGGNYLALVEGNKVRLFSLKTGDEAGSFDVPGAGPFGHKCIVLAFSPDGKQLAGLFEKIRDHRILKWDLTTGKQVGDHELEAFRAPFYDGVKLAWSPDGLAWLVNGESVYDSASGRLLYKLPEQRGRGSLVQLVAANQALTLTEANRKRSLTAHHLAKEQVAKMLELVKVGGSATDALLPALTEAKLADAKRITVPLAADWVAKRDAAPDAAKLAARPFKLAVNANEVSSLHVAPAGVLAVELQPNDTSPFHAAKRATGVERYDLLTGQQVGRFENKAPTRLAAIDAEGKWGLFVEAEKSQRLDLWNLGDSKHVVGWRPYAQEDEKNRAVTFAAVLGEQRVLTGNGHKVILWTLPACKAEYVVEVTSLSHVRVTGGGKYFVGLESDRVRCFDAATGQPSGDTAPIQGGGREARALAIKADGSEAAGLFNVAATPNTPWLVARWDLANGKLLDSFSFQASFTPGQAPGLVFAGADHLLMNGTYLIDLGRKEILWTYRFQAFAGKITAQPPDGRVWYAAADFPTQAASLVAAVLPEESALRTIKTVLTAPDALVKPGVTLSVQTELTGDQANRIKDGLRKNVQDALKRLELNVGEAAGLQLTLKVSERNTGETVEFRSLFPRIGENRFATTSVQLMELDCEAILTKDGKTLWQSPRDRFGMRTLGIVRIPQGENDIGKYLRTQMWDSAQAWGSRLQVPRYLMRTADGVLALPGTSVLQPTGPGALEPRR